MNFDTAFEKLIGHEGEFQNDPRDRGNWTTGVAGQGSNNGTKFGISAMAYPGEDIRNMTIERAKDLYKRDYWGRPAATRFPMASSSTCLTWR